MSRPIRTALVFLFGGILWGIVSSIPAIAEEKTSPSPEAVQQWDATIFTEDRSQMERMLYEETRVRLREANRRESKAWEEISNRKQWEAYRDPRIEALRSSLGRFPKVPDPLPVKITGEIKGQGYRIEKLVYESRPDLWVTANLYRPAKPTDSMPGLIICHSHHNPKTQSELQDMGILWARAGCVVLVPDQLGHGERRQHPFLSAEDYDGSFRPGRQDYYFRYNVGLQLHLVGESLIGWMAWDMMRGVDLLLSRPGVDPKRIILLGAVAGGGDPAAVTAALDPRIKGVVPFNFGGPQPETGTLGDEAVKTFNYAGSGSWESTRNLKDSADEGFLPWVIVGAAAPRALIYAHEFRWDREHDPVWERLQTIYGFYEAQEKLDFVTGFGRLKMSSEKASHCNNIGAVHRERIHDAFQKWFDISIPDEEFRDRRSWSELHCLNNDAAKGIELTPVHELADRLASKRLAKIRRQLQDQPAANRQAKLQKRWQKTLGEVEPYAAKVTDQSSETRDGVRIEKFVLAGEREIRVPVLLLIPERKGEGKQPLTILLAQSGKAELLKERAETIATLLKAGVAVCLPDLRGMGETRPGDGRGKRSWATSLSATELMLGQTLVGSRLKDLRSLLAYLRTRKEFDSRRFAVWGDSLAEVNPADRNLKAPRRISNPPEQSEPGGALLALFAGLFEEDLAAVVLARGGLVSWRSLLESPFLYVPHDAVIPGALTTIELSDITETLAPKPLWISGLVNGRNLAVGENSAETTYAGTRSRYEKADALGHFRLSAKAQNPADEIVPWLLDVLKD